MLPVRERKVLSNRHTLRRSEQYHLPRKGERRKATSGVLYDISVSLFDRTTNHAYLATVLGWEHDARALARLYIYFHLRKVNHVDLRAGLKPMAHQEADRKPVQSRTPNTH